MPMGMTLNINEPTCLHLLSLLPSEMLMFIGHTYIEACYKESSLCIVLLQNRIGLGIITKIPIICCNQDRLFR